MSEPRTGASTADSPRGRSLNVTFHIEHVLPRKLGGSDDPKNLALACERCYAFKGADLSGIDQDTGNVEAPVRPENPGLARAF